MLMVAFREQPASEDKKNYKIKKEITKIISDFTFPYLRSTRKVCAYLRAWVFSFCKLDFVRRSTPRVTIY